MAAVETAFATYRSKQVEADAYLPSLPLGTILGTSQEQQKHAQSATAGINASPVDIALQTLFEMDSALLRRLGEDGRALLLEELRLKHVRPPSLPGEGEGEGEGGDKRVVARKKMRLGGVEAGRKDGRKEGRWTRMVKGCGEAGKTYSFAILTRA